MPTKIGKNLDKSKLIKGLIKGDVFVPDLQRAINEGEEYEWTFDYKPKQGDMGWHPSSDCTPDLYDLYHRATTPKESLGPNARKAFMVGHFWHAWLQYVTVERLGWANWEDIERQKVMGWGEKIGDDWKPFHYVKGSADIAPLRTPKKGEYLVDFKTMNMVDFRQRTLPERLASKYECQLNMYMDMFDLDRAIIVGVMKDSPHHFKEIEFERNQKLIDAVYHKWHVVSECIDRNIEPPIDEETDLPLKGSIRP